jgi:RND family efflux transporter MFP subunit
MRALGIKVQALRHDAPPVAMPMPARAVLPPGGEHVVSAPVGGLVVQVYIQPSQAVAKGAPLVRIASSELGTLQLNLMQATSRSALARRTAERERALFAEGIIAQRRVQEADAALAEAQAALVHARAALRLAGMAGAEIDRVAADGRPQDAVTVTAGAAGIVTAVDVRPGQRVHPTDALLGLAQLRHLVLEIDVPAAQAARWPTGTRLAVQGRQAGAVVTGASPLVSASSQTTMVRAALSPGSGLRPGELVTVLAPLGAQADAWDVPLAALAHLGKQAYVFVRTRNGFEARPVDELGSAGQQVRVAGALTDGDAVAVAGVVALKGAWLVGKEGQ